MKALTFAVLLALGADPEAPKAERLAVAREGYTTAENRFRMGLATIDAVGTWSRRLRDAARETGTAPATAAQEHLDRMKSLEASAKAAFEKGTAGKEALLEARWQRSDAAAELAALKP